MTAFARFVVSLGPLPLAGVMLACQGTGASESPKASAVHQIAPQPASHAGHAEAATPLVRAAAAHGPGAETFTGSLDEIKQFIAYYHSIRLSPEQERLKVEALSAMAAPCCSRYSLATCCCPCNMAKAAWGLAARLITEKGYGAEQIRQAEASWLKQINPRGFSGDSCFTGGCTRPMKANGCGGMKEEAITF